MAPNAAPSSLADIRLERLRRLKELKARKAIKDAESAKASASLYPTPGDLAKLIDPSTICTPALNLMDSNLLEVANGNCERLIWSMPPQEGKSQRVSRTFPLWMLMRNPDLRIVIASYELGMARRWSRDIRNDIVAHPELGLKIRNDTAAANDWQLDGHKGGLYSVGVEGALTGKPADLLLIDDPVKGRAEADSETYRETAWNFWTETARTRLAPHAPVLLVMTRWQEDDLAGRLISRDETKRWRVINIPALCETGSDPLGRHIGEYLISARGRTVEQWEEIHDEVGERTWSALYQGHPAPAEGGMFKRGWWRYDDTPVSYRKSNGTMFAQGMDSIIQSWDMTFKNTDGTDFVVGQVWGRAGVTTHLLDQTRARLDFPQTCKAVEELSARWPQAVLKLIEDKANGPAVISQLRKKVPGMVPVNPEGNKQARASAVTPFVEAGNVYLPLPTRAPWITAFVDEHSAFPTGAHDDQVDATSQALARLMLAPSSTAFLDELVSEQGRGRLDSDVVELPE
jgi:predicted phage terminase large subunit-like protein